MKLLVLIITTIGVCLMPTNVCSLHTFGSQMPTKTYTTRVTAANFRSRINCEGKSLRKLAKRYGNICAVEQKTLPLYTPVHISGTKYTIVDVMHKPSVKKHYRRANKRGISLDLCLDLYLSVPTSQLHKYDLGITEIRIIK